MKTKKLAFLIFISICILVIAPGPILRLLHLLQKRGTPLLGESRQFFQAYPTPGSDLRFIEANIEVGIPPNASEIHFCLDGSDEKISRLRFNLPPPDFPFFIRSTFCDHPFVPLDPRALRPNEHEPEWWQPEEAVKLEECFGGNSYVHQQIMVDRSEQKSLIIYVVTVMDGMEAPSE